MGSSRKKDVQEKEMKCLDCRISMKKTALENEGLSFEGYQCPQCGHTVLTMDQLKNYNQLRDLRRIIPEKRKIVKIGNSLGITLPNILKDYGLEVGRNIEIEVIDHCNLHIKLC